MKRLIIVVLSLTVFSVEANYYGNSEISTYDPVTGYYYQSITLVEEGKGILSSSKSTRKITNLAIYDPGANTHKLLFEKNKARAISVVLFESAYQNNAIQFNDTVASYNPVLKNNSSVSERKLKDKLLVGVTDNDKKVTDLWVSKKDGTELKKLVSIAVGSSWHLDVKNSVIRVITIKNQDLKIQNYSW